MKLDSMEPKGTRGMTTFCSKFSGSSFSMQIKMIKLLKSNPLRKFIEKFSTILNKNSNNEAIAINKASNKFIEHF